MTNFIDYLESQSFDKAAWTQQMTLLLRQLDSMGTEGLSGWQQLLAAAQKRVQQYSGSHSFLPPKLSPSDGEEGQNVYHPNQSPPMPRRYDLKPDQHVHRAPRPVT